MNSSAVQKQDMICVTFQEEFIHQNSSEMSESTSMEVAFARSCRINLFFLSSFALTYPPDALNHPGP